MRDKCVEDRKLARIEEKLALLRCPNCCDNSKLLVLEEKALLCGQCQVRYPIVEGLPIFSAMRSSYDTRPIHLGRWKPKLEALLRTLIGTPLWFVFILYMSVIEKRNFFFAKASGYAPEVAKWLPFGWVSSIPYNLYLKAMEASLFSNLELRDPSLEIGGGGGDTSRLAFAGKRIDVDCEYYVHNMFSYLESGADIYEVTDLHVGGSIYKLPFRDSSFRTVVMVHVADHLVDIETAFKELSRVLRPGGCLAFSTYGGFVFHHLPMFRVARKLSERLAEKYKDWRSHRGFPWYGYSRYICDDPEEATGQNLFSVSQWKQLGERYGLDLIECRPFNIGIVWSSLMDIQYRGDPRVFRKPLYELVSYMVEKESRHDEVLNERDAANLFMVFQNGE